MGENLRILQKLINLENKEPSIKLLNELKIMAPQKFSIFTAILDFARGNYEDIKNEKIFLDTIWNELNSKLNETPDSGDTDITYITNYVGNNYVGNNYDNEDCVEINQLALRKWNDGYCDNSNPIVCQK